MYLENQDSFRRSIPLADIRRDTGIQPRTGLNEKTVASYTDLIREDEAHFPPVVIFYDGLEYLLADGFHRVAAVEQAGENEVFAEIRHGTREDAIRYACGANSKHGLPLTNKDKNQVVHRMLTIEDNKPVEQRLSQREIAKHCGVTQACVSKIKKTRDDDNRYLQPALPPGEDLASEHSTETDSVTAHGNGMPGATPTAAHASAAEIIDTIVSTVMAYLSQLSGVSVAMVEKHFQQAVTEIQCQIRSLSNLRQDD